MSNNLRQIPLLNELILSCINSVLYILIANCIDDVGITVFCDNLQYITSIQSLYLNGISTKNNI